MRASSTISIALLLLSLVTVERGAAEPLAALVVERAYCLDAKKNVKSACNLGDRLRVEVEPKSLALWRVANDPTKLVLFIDGRFLKGTVADAPTTGGRSFDFDLRPHGGSQEPNREAWRSLLRQSSAHRAFDVALGFEGKPERWGTGTITLEVFPGWLPWAILVVLLFLLMGFVILVRRSDIIRDPGPEPAPGERRYYSLARAQMAWWFFIVLASFLYIFLVTWDLDTLTTGTVALFGVSAATGLGAMALDSEKRKKDVADQATARTAKAELEAEIVKLKRAITAATPPGDPLLVEQLAVMCAALAEKDAILERLTPKSEGLIDVLRDDTGISFHRFQLVGWTLVLGVVFLWTVWSEVSMPDFNPTLLALMGITSGTYLGFKLPTTVPETEKPS